MDSDIKTIIEIAKVHLKRASKEEHKRIIGRLRTIVAVREREIAQLKREIAQLEKCIEAHQHEMSRLS